ncbi:TPA: hypothetical protein U9J56_001686 [Acinetobacter baumannii]|nr:hypothetical protein [Acinetobacter baumannii]
MKFNMKRVLVIIVFLIPFIFVSNYIANSLSKKNELYIEKVFKQDRELHKKYGNIEEYNLRKSGKYSGGGGNNEQSYYYYTYSVKGSNTDGMIKLKLYEDENKKIDGYTIEFIK